MKLRILWNRRQWLEFIGVLVVVGVVVWFGQGWYISLQPSDYGIMGQVTKVSTSDSTVKISGAVMRKVGATDPETTSQKELTILVNANTKFVKTVVHRPSKEELAKTEGGLWDMSKVKTEIISGQLSDLISVSSAIVKVSTNNPTRASYTAIEIDYYTIVD
jgi:hypothetical protein